MKEVYITEIFDFAASALAFEQISEIADNYDSRVKSLKTYEKTGVLKSLSEDITQYVERAFYYDYMNRPIQTVEKNHLGGISRYAAKYDFTGNVLAEYESHTPAAPADDRLKSLSVSNPSFLRDNLYYKNLFIHVPEHVLSKNSGRKKLASPRGA